MFEVVSIDKAREFIGNPEAAKAGADSGVIDGEYHFVEDAGGYWSPGGGPPAFGGDRSRGERPHGSPGARRLTLAKTAG